MIVCLCHGVNEKNLVAVAAEENGNFSAVCKRTRACTDCGSCGREVKAICKRSSRNGRALPLMAVIGTVVSS